MFAVDRISHLEKVKEWEEKKKRLCAEINLKPWSNKKQKEFLFVLRSAHVACVEWKEIVCKTHGCYHRLNKHSRCADATARSSRPQYLLSLITKFLVHLPAFHFAGMVAILATLTLKPFFSRKKGIQIFVNGTHTHIFFSVKKSKEEKLSHRMSWISNRRSTLFAHTWFQPNQCNVMLC